ncbi:hypothetical protein VJ918_05795 [Adlercreutzia sp. R21]|uniref:hypothetical protein n=1 Tax=Adlercreutzia wanghongyangiae TaxID=3111451 RepID=UPI002DB79722|nr:hypothetical protein [Adlercreutzia sp. R21]MEC4184320.1 hypothetical protein [Adlercreutzia sp. R21]
MNTNHAKTIKGMSIASIVLAALGILGVLITWMGLGAGGAAVSGSGYDYFYTDDGYIIETSDINAILGVLGILVFWVFVCLVLVLIAGIMGVRGANKPEKLKGVMTWNIVGAVASFLGAGIITLVLCIIVAVFANKDKQALTAAPYAAPAYAAVPTVPVQPQQPVAPQAPVTPAAAAPVAAQPLVSDPAPVTPAAAPAAEAVTTAEVAAAEPAMVLPDNYIEDAQASVTIVEETPVDGEQK